MTRQVRIARIVWVVLVMLTTFLSGSESDAGPSSVSRLSSSLGDFRLDSVSRREYGSWSEYAHGVYDGLGGGGQLAMLQGIERALLLCPTDVSLRVRWAELVEGMSLSKTVACSRFEPIYSLAPSDADTVLFYAKLLRDAGAGDTAKAVLYRGVELTDGLDGRILRDYVMACMMNGDLKGEAFFRHGRLGDLLRGGLSRKDRGDRDAFKIGLCYYLLSEADALIGRVNGAAGAPGVPKTARERKSMENSVAFLRKRAAELGMSIDLKRSDATTAFLLCVALDSLERYQELQTVLHQLADTVHQGGWWLQFSFKAAEATKQYGDLVRYLDSLTFNPRMSQELLRRSINAYLEVPGHLASAVAIARVLLTKYPKESRNKYLLAYLLSYSGGSREALQILDTVPQSDYTPAFHLLRSRALSGQGQLKEAYRYLRDQVAALRSPSAATSGGKGQKPVAEIPSEYYLRLGMLSEKLGRGEDALNWCKQYYEAEPDNAAACNLYGYMLAVMGRELPLAEKLLRKALTKEPKNVAYLDSLAWIRYQQGRYQEALTIMLQVLGQHGLAMDDDDEMRGHLRQIFLKLGMPESARLYELHLD